MMSDYEQKVKREEAAHEAWRRDKEIRRGWAVLSDREAQEEITRLDRLNIALYRRGLTRVRKGV